MPNQYPLQQIVRPGALLGSIAHAAFVARAPSLAHTQSWQGDNYSVQDSAGSRGTIAFAEATFVGVFFLESSDRNPFRSGKSFDVNRLFKGLPTALDRLGEAASQYLLQEVEGTARPVLTAAFWGDGKNERIGAAEPWNKVLDNGASLVRIQLTETKDALAAWEEEFELSPAEVELVEKVFAKKAASGADTIRLAPEQVKLLRTIADQERGWKACKESFAEIGVIL